MASTENRPYEIVLLGATGYTGQLAAEYIQNHVSTDLKWAIAGRNGKRLAEIADELRQMNPDRIQPAIEVVELNTQDLSALTAKTHAIITTVGPYARFGEAVVKACVENGAHVLDVTGETPFTYDMMLKYHEAARQKGVCIVPHCGIDSVPSDLLAYLVAKTIREEVGVGTREVVNSLQKISGAISGGTSHTAITLVESYPLTFLGKAMHPHALCPVKPPRRTASSSSSSEGVLSKILGYRKVDDLGILTDSPQAASDVGIVYRSWGLFDSGAFYGPNFSFKEYMRTSSAFKGTLIHYLFGLAMVALYLPPLRWLLKRYAYAPGTGPTREASNKDILSYKAIGTADTTTSTGSSSSSSSSTGGNAGTKEGKKRAVATFDYRGPGYYMTGICLVEAALVLTRGGRNKAGGRECLGKRLGGQITTATLEMEYVERLQAAGIKLEWGLLP